MQVTVCPLRKERSHERSIAQQAHGGDAQPIPDPHMDPGVNSRTRMAAMPTIESRIAPDGAVTYRAKVRIKGATQLSASFARKTDAAKWGHPTEVAIRENRYFRSSAGQALHPRGCDRSLRARGATS